MKREHGPYDIVLLDADGYTVTQHESDTLRQAKKDAKRLLEYPAHKAEVRNAQGECLADFFANV